MSAPAAAASSSAVVSSGDADPTRSELGASIQPRRLPPRHFHAGPNPAAPSVNDDAAAADTDHSAPSAAARLYRHALESIFAFLDQRELVTVLQVSRGWLDAVESMASLRLIVWRLSVPLREVAESAMGRHVTRLGMLNLSVSLTADSLFIVARLMPQLRELTCNMELTPTQGRLSFPPGLLQLELQIHGGPAAADVNAAIEAISRLPLLESLIVDLAVIDNQLSFDELELSFAPLVSLPLLGAFDIYLSNDDAELSDAQVAQLRNMPLLRQLSTQPMPTSSLRRLLASPHDLQWQEIGLPHPLDDEAAALLPQLPSLTQIDASFSASHFEWLPRLPNLTHVEMRVDKFGRASSLMAGLQRCENVEHLRLANCPGLRAAHLADLLPRLTRLRTLKLDSAKIASLSFLAQQPMVQQLSRLSVCSCRKLPVIELRHVHALKALKSLRIFKSFTAPLDDHSQWLLTPPSAALPQLEKFEYTP